VSPDGKRVYVAERTAGSVAVIDAVELVIEQRILVDLWPVAVCLAAQSNRLFVATQDRHRVWAIDLNCEPPKPLAWIPAVREPSCLVLTPDERQLVVTNLLPDGRGTDPDIAAAVTIVDTAALKPTANIALPAGSSSVNGACTSADGRWAYVVHGLGRVNMPITQLERGWVSTYALSLIDIAQSERKATLLLDDLTQGAANPFAVVASRDGRRLWISHAGVHEISTVDIGRVHSLLAGQIPEALADIKDASRANVWVRLRDVPQTIAELQNDLTALSVVGAIRRFPSGGIGPRHLDLSPDEDRLFVANYYSGSVTELDAERGDVLRNISLGPQPPLKGARRGEMLFHDATIAFQRWHSCASCHPNQGRVDGLRWDFVRDGLGNGKDTISLVYVDRTGPLNRRATRESARDCARSSIESGHMRVPTERDVDDLYAYLKSLEPEPSPLVHGDNTLKKAAERGKLLFDGRADCVRCHPPPYYTDQKTHNVGTLTPNEPDGLYDTPALIEAYRTAPYLHDGRARTLREVLTKHNEHGLHGTTAGLSEQELDDLETYILSL
jgi:YVTN family beta-propeller protein